MGSQNASNAILAQDPRRDLKFELSKLAMELAKDRGDPGGDPPKADGAEGAGASSVRGEGTAPARLPLRGVKRSHEAELEQLEEANSELGNSEHWPSQEDTA